MTHNSKPDEVLYPSAKVKILVRVAMLLVLAFFALSNYYLQPALSEWMKHQNSIDPSGAIYRRAVLIALSLAGMLILSLSYVYWQFLVAFRIYRSSTFPPPSYPILSKTIVVHGDAARKVARGFAFTGVAVAALTAYAVYGVFVIFKFADMLPVLYG